MTRDTDPRAERARWPDAEQRSDEATAEDGVSTARAPVQRRRRGAGRWLVWGTAGLAAGMVALTLLGPFLVRQIARVLNFSVQGFVWIVGGLEGGLDTWSLVA